MDKPNYPFDEFARHYDDLHEDDRLEPGNFMANVMRVNEYMVERYSDQIEKTYKLGRFILIMQYVSDHLADFDREDYAVFGSQHVGGLVSDHILRAVHEIFTEREMSDIGDGPGIFEVMQLADTYRKVA